MSSSRYAKLVEFAAHAGDVRCVRIGRKTAGVLVTGGDDKKVNVWALGKTTASFSLTGHQSSVESVSFDNDEMVVAAGGSNGSIKVFELQTGKVTKSLSGHKSNVMCLAWHPYDSTIISGSMDTNVKLWNLRDKEAVMTFKGHNAGVTHVRYSPDGNWVASASGDGAVKIWDVRQGRLLQDLCPPTKYEITGVEFSPTEYLMATSSRDKLVRFWDLETFACIDQTTPEATPVRNICFYNDGRTIFSAVQDGCRVWNVDPTQQQDYVDVPWYRVADLAISTIRGTQRLIGCSFNSTMVGLFYIVLKNVRPFCEDPDFMAREPAASVDGNPYAAAGGSRSNLAGAAAAAQLPPESAVRRLSLNDRAADPPRAGSAGNLGDAAAAAAAAAGYGNGRGAGVAAGVGPSVGVGRSQERSSSMGSRPPQAPSSSAVAAGGDRLPPVALYGAPDRDRERDRSSNRYAGAAGASADFGGGPGDSVASDAQLGRAASGHAAGARPGMVSIGVGVGDSLMRGQLQPDDLSRMAGGGGGGLARQRSQPREPTIEVHAPAAPPASRSAGSGPGYRGAGSGPDRGVGVGVGVGVGEDRDMDQRYPWQGQAAQLAGPSGMDRLGGGGGGAGGGGYASVVPSDLEAASALSSRHGMFLSAMKKRANTLMIMRNFVQKGDWRNAIAAARRGDDTAALADLLSAMHDRRDVFTLDLVGEVMTVVETVLSLPSDRQQQTGLEVLALHIRAFGPVIRDLCGPGARGVGIDLSFEERRERAAKAKLVLQNMVPRLNSLARSSETLGVRAGELAAQLAQL
uniref:Katanin p80 WD40 repeat-containing subunit B1 homolog n=1 Tax=Chlamydomonas reinhardtii TaxID=3055 RepID=Q6PLH8_CHLRE|nr:katanin p80 subunit PF15p [Chlamydomonas reinhardtii]